MHFLNDTKFFTTHTFIFIFVFILFFLFLFFDFCFFDKCHVFFNKLKQDHITPFGMNNSDDEGQRSDALFTSLNFLNHFRYTYNATFITANNYSVYNYLLQIAHANHSTYVRTLSQSNAMILSIISNHFWHRFLYLIICFILTYF